MKKIIIAVAAVAVMALTVGCQQNTTAKQPSAAQKSSQARDKSISNVMTATKTPVLEVSLDRENIAKRISRSNDGNHIQWMYLFGSTGAVIERFAVRGKATSGGKRLNAKHGYKKVRNTSGGYGTNTYLEVEKADEMGTFGNSAPYIFWFDLDDTLVQTNLDYLILDKPVNITGGVLRISDVDQKELQEKRELEAHYNKGGK